MPRMQHAGQRPCADMSQMRRTRHRHHQTAAEGGADCFNHTTGCRSRFWHRLFDYFPPFHEQGHGPAKSGGATAAKGGGQPADGCQLSAPASSTPARTGLGLASQAGRHQWHPGSPFRHHQRQDV